MRLFVSLETLTKRMITASASAGFFHSPGWDRDYPKIQILTIEELLSRSELKMPPTGMTFKLEQKVKEKGVDQGKMFENDISGIDLERQFGASTCDQGSSVDETGL